MAPTAGPMVMAPTAMGRVRKLMYRGPMGTLPRPTAFMTSSMATRRATRVSVRVFMFFIFNCPPAAVPPLASDTAQTCPLCAGFIVDILIVLLERVVSGRVPKRECRYRSPGKRMPADRRATVSTRLTAMEVSCMRVHSSWSPLSIARANVSNSAASRGRPPFRL